MAAAIPPLPLNQLSDNDNTIPNGNSDSTTISHSAQKHASSGAKTATPLKEAPVENRRRMRVVVIGAGFSGILMGIRIPEWLRNVDLTIYEKNAGLGGTWYENVYPGVACDIPGMLCKIS
jgi:heterodisulfide reductase subunit A-like polyferredoxin